jgi:nicotinamide phosphoribosyltransferase
MDLFAATNSDGYKLSHADMYADGTTKVYSNLTPRTDKIYRRGCTRFYDGRLVFFGGQAAIHEIVEMWNQSFFNVPVNMVIKKFKRRVDAYLGEGVISTERLIALWNLGYLPLEIKTLDEGLKVPMGVPVLTITNTIDEHFWLVNYLETVLSNLTWKTSTNATIAAEYKAILSHFAKKTGVDDFTVSIQAHDFSCRGMSGPEDAARSGMAHLTQFIGTDTLSAMDAVEDYYGCEGLLAISVPATEHAVSSNNILSIERAMLNGSFDGIPYAPNYRYAVQSGEEMGLRGTAEREFLKDLITRKYPKGIVSYVADTYDFWQVISVILPSLRQSILDRKDDANGLAKLVIRPDSGDPVKVVCGYKVHPVEFTTELEALNAGHYGQLADVEAIVISGEYFEVESYAADYDPSCRVIGKRIEETEVRGAIECLWEIFGGTETSTGHKLLDRHIGLIYGDSITTSRAVEILERLERKGFASGNIVFGVGSYTYQCNTRDTFGFAVKATYSVVDGLPINIFKDPKTDSKKKSAKGLLFVGRDSDDELALLDQVDRYTEALEDNFLIIRFKDGHFYNQVTFDEIRERLA